jgi:hypothetical protein
MTMGTRKITPGGGRKPTETRAAARDRGVPSTPAELARAAAKLTPQQVASIGASLLIAERLERLDLSLSRVLDVLVKHAGHDVAVATAEAVEAIATSLDHLARRVAVCEAHCKIAGAPGLSFRGKRRGTKQEAGAAGQPPAAPADSEGGGDGGAR